MKSKNITPGIIYTTRGWRSMADVLDDSAEKPEIKTLRRNKVMKSKNEANGFASHTNGIVRPPPGNGLYICRNCGHRFLHTRHRLLSELIGDFFVRCPKCKSLRTEKNRGWVS
jgi:DNA-directed RNA polymerase subunit RPC12/RpoP